MRLRYHGSSLFQDPGMRQSRLPFLFLVEASHRGQHSLCHRWQGLLDRLRYCVLGLGLCLSCCNWLQRKQLVNYVVTKDQFPLNGQLYPSSLFQGPGMCRSRLPFLFLVQASHHGQHSLCHHWQGLLDRLRNCYLGLCLCLSCCNCLQRKQLVNYVAVPGFSFH